MMRFFLSNTYRETRKIHLKRCFCISENNTVSIIKNIIPNKNQRPKISLITVAFDRQETITDTIMSVKAQTYTNFEYIIIDGASTDNTLAIIKQYSDVISSYVSEPDKGIYDAMNKGIAKANGDIIGFINADDILANPDVLQAVADTFVQNDIDACYADLEYVEQFNLNKVKRYWHSSIFKRGSFSKGWSPPHPTFYVKKSIYQQFGTFSLNYKLGNDIELMLRFLERYKIKSLYVPNLWVKMRMGGVSNQSISNIIQQNIEIIKAAKDNGLSFNIFKFVFFKLTSRFAQYFLK
jgi:glycosyltransferase involved in cell wall biosynthesis